MSETGTTRAELMELRHRIIERGLQLRRVPPDPSSRWSARNPEPLSTYELTIVGAALSLMADMISPTKAGKPHHGS